MPGSRVLAAVAVLLLAITVGLAITVNMRSSASNRQAGQEAAAYNATATAVPSVGLPTTDRIVTVLGDNMSAVSQSARAVQEWPLIVAGDLGVRLVSMSTAGSGYTAKPLSWTYGGTFLTRAPHVAAESKLVVVFGGANDAGVRTSRLSDSAVNTVIAIRKAAPQAKVLLVGPVHTSTDLSDDLRRVRDTLRSVATAQKATFVDPIDQRWVDGQRGVFGTDGVSLTADGQQLIAKKMAPVLAAALAS